MVEYKRILDPAELLEQKSFFLLGPRGTGKSYLLRRELKDRAVLLNLLRTELYLRLSAAPWELESLIDAQQDTKQTAWVVIDEIQKVPQLLDEVHRLIEEKQIRFLLTGSSARKLKTGHVNLLAGRAWTANLFPLCYAEIPNFDLETYLRWGGLPSVYPSRRPSEELKAYVDTYLYEEIQAEGVVRKLPQFSRFLVTAALSNGQQLNFAKIASDTGVPASTIREYYKILEDTLLGFQLLPWEKSLKRKAVTTAKFYFCDIGVAHTLAQTKTLDRNSDLFGRCFEHWIGMELKAYLSYKRRDESLGFWRTHTGQEVDFVLGDDVAIEVKVTRHVVKSDLRGLQALQEEGVFKQLFLVSQDEIETKHNGIVTINWKRFVSELWAGKII